MAARFPSISRHDVDQAALTRTSVRKILVFFLRNLSFSPCPSMSIGIDRDALAVSGVNGTSLSLSSVSVRFCLTVTDKRALTILLDPLAFAQVEVTSISRIRESASPPFFPITSAAARSEQQTKTSLGPQRHIPLQALVPFWTCRHDVIHFCFSLCHRRQRPQSAQAKSEDVKCAVMLYDATLCTRLERDNKPSTDV